MPRSTNTTNKKEAGVEGLPLAIAASSKEVTEATLTEFLCKRYGDMAALWEVIPPEYIEEVKNVPSEEIKKLQSPLPEAGVGTLPEAQNLQVPEVAPQVPDTPPKQTRKRGGQLTSKKAKNLEQSQVESASVEKGSAEVLYEAAVREGQVLGANQVGLKIMAEQSTMSELETDYIAARLQQSQANIKQYQQSFDGNAFLISKGLKPVGNSLTLAQQVAAQGLGNLEQMTKEIMATALPKIQSQEDMEIEQQEED